MAKAESEMTEKVEKKATTKKKSWLWMPNNKKEGGREVLLLAFPGNI